MKRAILLSIALLGVLGLSGCSYLFYPRAGDYAAQAKGANGVETMINLTNMMEASAAKAKGGKGVDPALDDYHNQLHALLDSYCGVTKEQAKTPAYDLAVTHKIVDKSGAWFSFQGERIGQGRENARQFFRTNKETTARVEALIKEQLMAMHNDGAGLGKEEEEE
jgi:hypothetical protein